MNDSAVQFEARATALARTEQTHRAYATAPNLKAIWAGGIFVASTAAIVAGLAVSSLSYQDHALADSAATSAQAKVPLSIKRDSRDDQRATPVKPSALLTEVFVVRDGDEFIRLCVTAENCLDIPATASPSRDQLAP